MLWKERRKQLFNPHGSSSCRQWQGTNLWPFILRQFEKRVDDIRCRQRPPQVELGLAVDDNELVQQ